MVNYGAIALLRKTYRRAFCKKSFGVIFACFRIACNVPSGKSPVCLGMVV